MRWGSWKPPRTLCTRVSVESIRCRKKRMRTRWPLCKYQAAVLIPREGAEPRSWQGARKYGRALDPSSNVDCRGRGIHADGRTIERAEKALYGFCLIRRRGAMLTLGKHGYASVAMAPRPDVLIASVRIANDLPRADFSESVLRGNHRDSALLTGEKWVRAADAASSQSFGRTCRRAYLCCPRGHAVSVSCAASGPVWWRGRGGRPGRRRGAFQR